MIQVLADPAAAAREFREATQDRQFELRPQLTFGERVLGRLRALFGIRPLGTPEYQSGTPWTGWGPLDEVAGVVHRREAVIPWDVLRRGPAAVLEFLGAPGFQEGKLGAPLGIASVQSQAGALKRQNEEALGELQRMGGLLSGLSERWDEVIRSSPRWPRIRPSCAIWWSSCASSLNLRARPVRRRERLIWRSLPPWPPRRCGIVSLR